MAWRKPANLSEWVHVFLRHKKMFMWTATPVAVVMVIFSHFVPREYSASGELEIRNDLAIRQVRSSPSDQAQQPIRRLLPQDLTSKSAVKQVIEDLDLLRGRPIFSGDGELTEKGQIIQNEMIASMQKRINVRYRARFSEVERVVVSYTDQDRDLVPQVVKKLVDNYIQLASEEFEGALLGTKKFFEHQVAKHQEKHRESEARKMRFEKDYPGLMPDDPASVDVRVEEYKAKLARIEDALIILTSKRKALQEWAAEQPEQIVQDERMVSPELDRLLRERERIEEARFKFEDSPGKPSPLHPRLVRFRERVVEIDERIAQARKSGTIEEETVPNAELIRAGRDIEEMNGELRGLEQQRNEGSRLLLVYETQKRNFVQLRSEYILIKRDIAESNSQLKFWTSRLRQTMIALQASVGNHSLNMNVIEQPEEVITKPSSPTLASILLTVFVIGGGAGILGIILVELTDHSFRTVQHAVDDLKLPVLGAVNEIVTPATDFRRKVRNWGLYPAITAVMILFLLASIYLANLSLTDPDSYKDLTSRPVKTIGNYLLGRS